MKLNHLDLQVADVPAAVDLFERYFGLELRSKRGSPAIAFLDDGHGFTLVLQRARGDRPVYPDGFHVGFLVDDEETVRERHARLCADGVGRLSGLIENGRGLMFYLDAQVLIEVSCRRGRVDDRG